MQFEADIDGVDFRPFFDMVVGILFVLLILIGALLFFQQSSQDEAAAKEAERNARILEAQTVKFLEKIAGDLRQHGFDPRIDLPNRTVSVPLAGFAKIGPDGLPEVPDQAVKDLGTTLAGDLQCVLPGATSSDPCKAYDHVQLNLASVRVQAGGLQSASALPQDQFARLLTSEFSTALFRGVPRLLNLTNAAGLSALETAGQLSAAAALPGESIAGEVAVHLDLAPP